MGLESGYEPTRFRYDIEKNLTRVSLGTPSKYEYDWFLGGVDTCQVGDLFPTPVIHLFQGDSGGPLWRNLKVSYT